MSGLQLTQPLRFKGVKSDWLSSLPDSGTEMLTISSAGVVSRQAIPSASFGALTGSPSDNAALQSALDAKLNLSGGTLTGTLTAPEYRSPRAGSLSHVSPQNNIVLYGGFSGYGIGFDGNGELGTVVNSTLRSRLGQHLGLGSAGQVRFNSSADTSGSWDTLILRNATGPTLETRSANGLKVCNADGSDIAQLEAKSILFNSQVRDQYGIGFRSQAGYMTFYGFNTVGSNSPTMSVDTAGVRVVGKTIIGAANYSEAFGSEALKVNGTAAIGGQCRLQSDAGFASLSPTVNRNFLLASGGVQLWNEGSFRSFLDWSTLGTVRFTDGSTGRVGIDVGAITTTQDTTSRVAFTVQAISGSAANFFECKNSSGTIVASVGASGTFGCSDLRIAPLGSSGLIRIGSTGVGTVQIGGTGYGTSGQAAIRSDGTVVVRSTGGLAWTDATNTATGTLGTGIIASSAGVVEINNGTAGQTRDLSCRAITANGTVTSGMQTLVADPSTVDITTGLNRMVKNATSGEVRHWVNDGGTMKSVLFS